MIVILYSELRRIYVCWVLDCGSFLLVKYVFKDGVVALIVGTEKQVLYILIERRDRPIRLHPPHLKRVIYIFIFGILLCNTKGIDVDIVVLVDPWV
jgi:hypothetical protein